MGAKLWTPGENAQEIFTDTNGSRFDARGNLIEGGPTSDLNWQMACYRTERGQTFRYADVFPGPTNVHQNVPLSDFAIAWEIENPGIAAKVAPVATVAKRSDIYYYIGDQGQETLRTPTDESDLRGVGATANEVQNVFDHKTFTVVNRAYRDFLPDEVADNADEVLNLSQSITSFLETKLMQRWDARVIALLAAANSGFASVSFQTACGTGGKHISDATQTTPYITFAINYLKQQVILSNGQVPANTMVSGLDVCQAISASPEIRPQVVYDIASQYVERGGLTDNQLTGGLPEKAFGVKQVCAYNSQNTAKKGQANSFSAQLSNVIYLLHVGAPGRRTLNSLTTFRKGGVAIRTYRDEGRRGMYIEAEIIQTEIATNSNGGIVCTAPIS